MTATSPPATAKAPANFHAVISMAEAALPVATGLLVVKVPLPVPVGVIVPLPLLVPVGTIDSVASPEVVGELVSVDFVAASVVVG